VGHPPFAPITICATVQIRYIRLYIGIPILFCGANVEFMLESSDIRGNHLVCHSSCFYSSILLIPFGLTCLLFVLYSLDSLNRRKGFIDINSNLSLLPLVEL
jgi:hypothetical protein